MVAALETLEVFPDSILLVYVSRILPSAYDSPVSLLVDLCGIECRKRD